MNRKEDYIAVFDSGLGGISVLQHLRRLMPGERFFYYGDSANAPYGTRSRAEVEQLTLKAADHLMRRGIKALVVACNTATSAAIATLRQTHPDLIVIGIEPALKPAADRFPGGTIGVMATPMTLREEKFAQLMHRFGEHCTIHKLPAPLLVPLVEQGKANSLESEAMLREILTPCIDSLDALVLGCTHYPFAKKTLRRILTDRVVLLDGGEGTARETRRRLMAAGLLENGPGELVIENSSPDPEMMHRAKELLNGET